MNRLSRYNSAELVTQFCDIQESTVDVTMVAER